MASSITTKRKCEDEAGKSHKDKRAKQNHVNADLNIGVFNIINVKNLRHCSTYEKSWASYFHHPIVIQCREMLTNGVIGHGVALRQKIGMTETKRLGASDALDMILCNHYERAARNALSWLFVTGVVPVYFELLSKDENVGRCWVPVVPDHDAVDILVYPTNWNKSEEKEFQSRVTYKCVTKQEDDMFGTSGDAKTNTLEFNVMQFSAHTPTAEGKLITPLASCVPFLDEITYLKELKYKAESVRSNPPVMVSHVQPSKRVNTTDAMPNIDMVAGVAHDIAQENVLSQVRVEYVQDMPFSSSMQTNEMFQNATKNDRVLMNAAMHKEEARKQFTFLPRDHCYVNQHLPSVPEDYCRLVSDHETKIRTILGVHATDTQRSKNTTDNNQRGKEIKIHKSENQSMNMSMVNRYRSDINQFLKRSFSISQHLASQMTDEPLEDDNATSNRGTDCIYERFSDLPDRTSVVLRASPFIDTHVLDIAAHHGYIDQETMRNIFLDIINASF